MRWRLAVVTAVSLLGCRDLTLPPPPGAGSVSGRVLYAVPGKAERRPAAGAVISLVGTGLNTTTNAGGAFTLDVEETSGLLLFRFDADSEGTVDQQLVLQLSDYGTGPNKRVSIGDVLLGQNAAVHGKVLRADLGAARSGHVGSAVFVPEGPFSAFTNDDGSFELPNLPAGPLSFMVFRAGYTAISLGSVTLRPGEDFGFRDVVLEVSTEPQVPGRIQGAVGFAPPASGLGDTRVRAEAPGQVPLEAVVRDDRSYSLAMAPPGLYSVTASRTGYTSAAARNVLVLPGQETTVSTITLTDVPEIDAGLPPRDEDAGALADAGFDAGVCTRNASCAANQWCDDGVCTRQCASNLDCTNGRACELTTRTCVRPCTAGCPTGQVCDVANDTCRVACDSSFPCGPGFRCDAQNHCVPECTVAGDCGQPWLTCQAGQCRPNSVCAFDAQCAPEQFCLVGGCVPRPTQANDAGLYACTTPCQCRQGEWCAANVCQLDPVLPTRFFKADAGGDGTSSVTPSNALVERLADAGPSEVFALRAGDLFVSEGPFELAQSDQALIGGYTECAPGRWVRDPARRTALRVLDGGTVMRVNPSGTPQLQDLKVWNLELTATQTCEAGLLNAWNVARLETRNVRGAWGAESCGGSSSGAVTYCTSCDDVVLSDTLLAPSPDHRAASSYVVRLYGGNGLIRGTTVEPQVNVLPSLTVVSVESPTGAVTVEDTRLTPLTAPNVTGVTARSCYSNPLLIQRSTLAWPLSLGGGYFYGIGVSSCGNARLLNNRVDGTGVVGGAHQGYALWTSYSAGEIADNLVVLPNSTSVYAVRGLDLSSVSGALSVQRNQVLGGSGGQMTGLALTSTSSGPVRVSQNVVDIGPSPQPLALLLSSVNASAAVTIEDNTFRATGEGTCLAGDVAGATFESAAARVERNRFVANRGGNVYAVRVNYPGQLELASNHLFAGLSGCSSQRSVGLLTYNGGQVFLRGNTLDPRGEPLQPAPTRGIVCEYPPNTVLAEGNLIGGGRGDDHRALEDLTGGPCFESANFSSNYFWYEHPQTGLDGGDALELVVAADAGVTDARGNRFGGNVSCFAPNQAPADGGLATPYLLAPGSPCVDTGQPLFRGDLSPITLDVDGLPRDAGARPDIGCSERR